MAVGSKLARDHRSRPQISELPPLARLIILQIEMTKLVLPYYCYILCFAVGVGNMIVGNYGYATCNFTGAFGVALLMVRAHHNASKSTANERTVS